MKTATVLIALLVIIVGAVVLWSEKPTTLTRPAPLRSVLQSIRPTHGGPKKTVVLFFVSQDQKILQEETREIPGAATTTEDAKRTMAELVRGPESDLAPSLPRAAQVRNLFIDASGTAYVDFDKELREGHRGGAQEDLYAVFSIVDTLTSNFAQIKRVQILVEGGEIPTLAGNVDMRMPLSPRQVF